jgi:hypothetical protein
LKIIEAERDKNEQIEKEYRSLELKYITLERRFTDLSKSHEMDMKFKQIEIENLNNKIK